MRRMLAALCVAALVHAGSATAQKRPVEVSLVAATLGFQAGGGSTLFGIQISDPVVMLGVPVADKVSFEPRLGVSLSTQEDFTFFAAGFALGVPIHLNSSQRGMFFEPLAALSFLNANASGWGESDVQFGAGLALGTKLPIGDQVSVRLEAPIVYYFESDWRVGTFSMSANVGFSIFLR